MARKTVRDQRRTQILEALYSCLLKKPFKETSIRDIAQAAGVNHGVLHYYFRHKEDILLSFMDYTIETYVRDYLAWMEERLEPGASEDAVIETMFGFAIDKITLNRKLSKIFVEIWEISIYNSKIRTRLRRVYRRWVDMVAEVLTKKTGNEQEARRISLTVIAFLEGMSLFSVIFDEKDYPIGDTLKDYKSKISGITGRK